MTPSSIVYIPHGGGPLPLLNHEGHKNLIPFLSQLGSRWPRPSAIVVISAHWEEEVPTVTSAENPGLLYDYYGFPDESYQIQYPAPGSRSLAEKIVGLLQTNNMAAQTDPNRGLDHGVFVPLKLIYPHGEIPVVQLSLLKNLDSKAHIEMGKALAPLCRENILFVGSGFSFHNLNAMFSQSSSILLQNDAFQNWLEETCTNPTLSNEERESRLIQWTEAPYARTCHPREEHLLPLHVCFGLAFGSMGVIAQTIFKQPVMGFTTCAWEWK